MSEERELYEIRHQLECIYSVLERLMMAAERLAPERGEREQVALQFCLHGGESPEEGFRAADWFLDVRDKQRAQQAEQGRAE